MATPTAADVAAKWVQNLSGASESIRRGVQAVTEAPTAAAARAVDLWQQRVSSQSARDKFQRNLQRVTLEQWRNDMLTKGLNRIATGAQAARPKFEAFMSQFLPFVESVAQRVRQMPKTTLEDRIQRAVAQMRGNAEFRRSA